MSVSRSRRAREFAELGAAGWTIQRYRPCVGSASLLPARWRRRMSRRQVALQWVLWRWSR
jgi:hypothetical protein